jgi:hypothetical protein
MLNEALGAFHTESSVPNSIATRRVRCHSRLISSLVFCHLAMSNLVCGAAFAQHVPQDVAQPRAIGVVELFTSQGCPKCPPADRLIADLARQPGTIAVSFAVNYWDYIGWKDTLASPAFSARQQAYAEARGDRRVFTPQAIVDGRGVEPGADKDAILRDMRALQEGSGASRVPMSVVEAGGFLRVHIGKGVAQGPIGVYVLRVAHTETVQIARGENSGRSVTYTNVVRAMNKLGAWTGDPTDYQTIDLKGDDEGYVVLLQAGSASKPGLILAAAKTAGL